MTVEGWPPIALGRSGQSRPRGWEPRLAERYHCPNGLQIVSHDRTSRRAASDLLEARTCERRGRTCKSVRRAVRYIRIYWIRFERCSPRTLGGVQSREGYLCHYALLAVAPV